MSTVVEEARPTTDSANPLYAIETQVGAENRLYLAIAELMFGHGYTNYEIRDLTEQLTGSVVRRQRHGALPTLLGTAPWVSRNRHLYM